MDRFEMVEFKPRVKQKNIFHDMDTGKEDVRYLMDIKMSNGDILEEKEMVTLKGIDYFEEWECPDSLLNRADRKKLEYELQKAAREVELKKIFLCSAGWYAGINRSFMVLGDQVIGYDGKANSVRIKNPKEMRHKAVGSESIRNVSRRLISFLPGVTEMLFYGSLLTILKLYLSKQGYRADFMLALIGPSGHLKTTFVRGYSLWLKHTDEQEMTFRDFGRFEKILEKIDELKGLNYLGDDLHDAQSRNSAEKQGERLDLLSRHISSELCCAQVILTGEKLQDMCIFSCMDRILQIKVPRMNSEELGVLKGRLKQVGLEYMPGLALAFADALVKNQDNLQNDVEEFMAQNQMLDSGKDNSLRIARHALWLKLTERLYRKYVLNSSMEDSCKEQLYEAVERNYVFQSQELRYLRSNEERDVVVDIYHMLNGGHLECVTSMRPYENAITNDCMNGMSYCFHNNKIYITQNALQTGMARYYGQAYSAKKISDAMHDAGILEEDTDARTKKFAHKRHYVINRELLKQHYERYQQRCSDL